MPGEPEETVSFLHHESPQQRATMLAILVRAPSGDPAIRAAVETLLDDRALCRSPPPYRVLEVRRLAAMALAAERRAADIAEPVVLRAAAPDLDLGEIGREAQFIFGDQALRWPAERSYRALRDGGHLPLADLVIPPR